MGNSTLNNPTKRSPTRANISCLPIDILQLILSYLPHRPRLLTASLVCHRWKRCVALSIHSLPVITCSERRFNTSRLSPSFLLRCSNLTELQLRCSGMYDRLPSSVVAALGTKVQSLALLAGPIVSMIGSSRESSTQYWSNFSRLTSLYVSVLAPLQYDLLDLNSASITQLDICTSSNIGDRKIPIMPSLRGFSCDINSDFCIGILKQHYSVLTSLSLHSFAAHGDVSWLLEMLQHTVPAGRIRRLAIKFWLDPSCKALAFWLQSLRVSLDEVDIRLCGVQDEPRESIIHLLKGVITNLSLQVINSWALALAVSSCWKLQTLWVASMTAPSLVHLWLYRELCNSLKKMFIPESESCQLLFDFKNLRCFFVALEELYIESNGKIHVDWSLFPSLKSLQIIHSNYSTLNVCVKLIKSAVSSCPHLKCLRLDYAALDCSSKRDNDSLESILHRFEVCPNGVSLQELHLGVIRNEKQSQHLLKLQRRLHWLRLFVHSTQRRRTCRLCVDS